MIRPDSQIVPVDEKTSGTIAQPATGPERPPCQPERRDDDQDPDHRPAADQRDRVGPPDQGLGIREEHGHDAHVGRPRVVPPPLPMHGVEQGQAVDGQVAVEVVLGIEDQGNRIRTVQTRPRPSITQGQRGRRSVASRGRTDGSWSADTVLRAVSDEQFGHGTAEAGQLGEVFEDLASLSKNESGSSSGR